VWALRTFMSFRGLLEMRGNSSKRSKAKANRRRKTAAGTNLDTNHAFLGHRKLSREKTQRRF
jgi:hypothetical protein